MLKKTLPIFASVVLLVGLTACTSSSDDKKDTTNTNNAINNQQEFVAPVDKVEKLPYFKQDVKGLGFGVWGEGNKPDPKKADTNVTPSPKASDEPEVGDNVDLDPNAPLPTPVDPALTEHPDTILFYNIDLNDTSTKCKITGTISYLDTYLSARGDSFNSFEQLYDIPPSSENPVTDASTEEINGVTYATGSYTTPEEWGQNPYHKTAVRVFSNPVERIKGSDSVAGELGNWNSDATTGLPVVSIDFSCPTEADLTDARWDDGTQWFQLVLNKDNPYDAVSEDLSTPLPGTETTEDK